MEPLSCVVDATTLVEHIHEIKSWIYNGQLRLVVPLSTYERVEQLSRDCKEKTLKRLEPPKQKPSSKPARKAHPAFDINSQVAEEFLARLKLQNSEQFITFQQPSEEYSSWKGVELPAEKKEFTEDGPTTWAKAAMTNLTSKVTLSNRSDDSKGLLKPKLVARAASAEISPWKINKKAPKISPNDVHPALRPFLSYVLWRLYENVITRADSMPSIIVSDDPNICSTARKLNITAQKVGELREIIFPQKADIDRNFFGDLEQEFGIRDSKVQCNGKIHVSSSVQDVPGENRNDVEVREEISNKIEVNGAHVETDGHQSKIVEAENEELGEKAATHQVNGDILDTKNGSKPGDPEEQKAEEVRGPGAIVAVDLLDKGPEHAVASEPKLSAAEEKPWVVVEEPQHIPEDMNGTRTKQGLHHAKTEEHVGINGDTPGGVTVSIQRQPTPNNTHTQSQQSPTRHSTTEKSTPSSRRSSNGTSPGPAKSVPELEDSDEEVVVFNPKAKRLSAQQKAPRQFNSRPSNKVDKVHPAPAAQTPVIDPDAFGRSFATNPRPNYIQNGYHSRYSPRGSPRRGQRMNQPDVDYVLKSGTTREASRGQGKLWVP